MSKKHERFGTPLNSFMGYDVYYQTGYKKFVAYDGENKEVASAETEAKLEDRIKASIKTKFLPVEVIDKYHRCIATITSRTMDEPDSRVWISWKEGKENHHEKTSIRNWGEVILYEKTAENLSILEKVQKLDAESKRLKDEADALLRTLTNPYKLPKVRDTEHPVMLRGTDKPEG